MSHFPVSVLDEKDVADEVVPLLLDEFALLGTADDVLESSETDDFVVVCDAGVGLGQLVSGANGSDYVVLVGLGLFGSNPRCRPFGFGHVVVGRDDEAS